MDSNLFQDTKTGKLVVFIATHDKEYAMVRDASGTITYVTLDQLVPYSREKGRLAKVEAPQIAPDLISCPICADSASLRIPCTSLESRFVSLKHKANSSRAPGRNPRLGIVPGLA